MKRIFTTAVFVTICCGLCFAEPAAERHIAANGLPVAGSPEARAMYSTRQRRPVVVDEYYMPAPAAVFPATASPLMAPVPPADPNPDGTSTLPPATQIHNVIPAELGTPSDRLYMRLARIQLEKKNLEESLQLVEKITTKAFKVAVLVNFAEYVSRDDNYANEAQQLFVLAKNALAALDAGKAVSLQPITTPLKTNVKPVEPIVEIEPIKPTPPVKPIETIKPIEPPIVEEDAGRKPKEGNANVPPTIVDPFDHGGEKKSSITPEPESSIPAIKPELEVPTTPVPGNKTEKPDIIIGEPDEPEKTKTPPNLEPIEEDAPASEGGKKPTLTPPPTTPEENDPATEKPSGRRPPKKAVTIEEN